MNTTEPDSKIEYALVCLRTGALLDAHENRVHSERMRTLGAAAPELFGADSRSDLSAIFARVGSEHCDHAFHEVVFVSATSSHVVQRLRNSPDIALMALSTEVGQLGLILSGMRARVLELEARP